MTLSVRFHDRNRTAELVTRLTNDTYRVQDAMVAWVTTLLPELLTLAGMVTVMMLIDLPKALTAQSAMPVLVVVVAARRLPGTAEKALQLLQAALAAGEQPCWPPFAATSDMSSRHEQAFGSQCLSRQVGAGDGSDRSGGQL